MNETPRWQDLPIPEEVEGFTKYTSIIEFRAAGGDDRASRAGGRWTVSMARSGFSDDYPTGEDNVVTAVQALELGWQLFTDGGWTMFAWDSKNHVGWSFNCVGPEWTKYLSFIDRNSPGARKLRAAGFDPEYKRAKKKAKKKAAKKKVKKRKLSGGVIRDHGSR